MNSDDLLHVIEAAGDAPEHILQLRKLVVACAMAGDLTDTKTSTSPAAIVAAIEKARLALLKKGQIPKSKPLPLITDEDLPMDFPRQLFYVPLGSIAQIEKGLTGIKDAKAGPYPLVVTAAERSTCDHADFVGPAAIVPLVSSTGHGNASINRLHYHEGEFALGTILAAILPFDGGAVSARFIFEYLSAFKDQLLAPRMTGSANVTLTLGTLSSVPVPVICPKAQASVDKMMALLDRLEAARAAREETRSRLTAATLSRLTEAEADTPTAARFALQTLHALTTRPDQIKSIRQTILNLAVRGKLVEQYSGDEPANAALLQIAKRKEASNLRRPKKVPPITQEERWASTPTGWAWTRWDYITDWITYGFTRPMEHFPSGIPIVTGKNVIDGKIDYSTAHFASRAAFDSLNNKDKPQPGDVLITKDGSIGRTAVVREDHGDFCINQSVAVLWLRSCHLSREYIQLVLDCPQTQQELQARTAGVAIKHISITDLGKMIWPVPPLAEQHRIVAKVEELMSLCDRLERALQDATTTRARLLDATLREVLAGAQAPELVQ